MPNRNFSLTALVVLIFTALAGCRYSAQAQHAPAQAYPASYKWLRGYNAKQAIGNRIAVPQGYERVPVTPGSFAAWLRGLPLKKGCPPVRLYDGSPKNDQTVHVAVVNMDVGRRDLQQCADAVMRLRAEYLFSQGKAREVHFDFTNGTRANFANWADGDRPVISGNQVRWERKARPDASYQNFRAYLMTVFNYAGTASLSKELTAVRDVKQMQIGDVFIKGGFPGHAVIVVDMAREKSTGKALFLLAQSYMPAQEMHLLKNPLDQHLSPWYPVDFGDDLTTPEWLFKRDQLMRF
ncbi:MAG TPA: DUF4846 domain-containing protein [Armatimonadota bacterium]